MALSDEDVERIANAVVEKAREDVEVRDVIIGSAMGKGAIPLYDRETRKELCSCCLIDPEGLNEPENRMCTTKGAIGTLKDSEEREWCSEINIVADGRCARARAISEAARVCKEKYPEDTAKFFECYIPAFSQAARGSNPDSVEGERLWYSGEWWEKEYSTAECVVYRSADGKKRLNVFWDGTKEVVARHSSNPSNTRVGYALSSNDIFYITSKPITRGELAALAASYNRIDEVYDVVTDYPGVSFPGIWESVRGITLGKCETALYELQQRGYIRREIEAEQGVK